MIYKSWRWCCFSRLILEFPVVAFSASEIALALPKKHSVLSESVNVNPRPAPSGVPEVVREGGAWPFRCVMWGEILHSGVNASTSCWDDFALGVTSALSWFCLHLVQMAHVLAFMLFATSTVNSIKNTSLSSLSRHSRFVAGLALWFFFLLH